MKLERRLANFSCLCPGARTPKQLGYVKSLETFIRYNFRTTSGIIQIVRVLRRLRRISQRLYFQLGAWAAEVVKWRHEHSGGGWQGRGRFRRKPAKLPPTGLPLDPRRRRGRAWALTPHYKRVRCMDGDFFFFSNQLELSPQLCAYCSFNLTDFSAKLENGVYHLHLRTRIERRWRDAQAPAIAAGCATVVQQFKLLTFYANSAVYRLAWMKLVATFVTICPPPLGEYDLNLAQGSD
ncbi:hypothetical protein EVAR_17558_1 [Eumeta japonica]|uniref:Uncharacterized protein n=1 Tax=Eumeta variegata TaxID=151549 RepID=A0A4C1UBW3_EUMVA|nr:hypothetical protein EVAR_17558_1 [Eumeta japonica]